MKKRGEANIAQRILLAIRNDDLIEKLIKEMEKPRRNDQPTVNRK